MSQGAHDRTHFDGKDAVETEKAAGSAASTSRTHHCGGHHGHGHVHESDDGRRLAIALLIIGGFAILEVIGGLISGSLALLADAGHMVTDASAIALALFAKHLASRGPSARFPFGQRRAQVLAAFVNGLGLLVLIGFLLIESFKRVSEPQPIDATVMGTVAVVGLLANFAAFAILHGGDRHDVNMRGAILHVIGDILGSVAAIISALVIAGTGWLLVDPLVTLIVCGLIARSALLLVRETGHVLLEGAPPGVDGEAIREAVMAEVPQLSDVHDVRAWMLTPTEFVVAMHVQVSDPMAAGDALRGVKSVLERKFSLSNSTVQVECPDEPADPAIASDEDDANVRRLVTCPDRPAPRASEERGRKEYAAPPGGLLQGSS